MRRPAEMSAGASSSGPDPRAIIMTVPSIGPPPPARNPCRIAWVRGHCPCSLRANAQTDPLASWNDGAANKSITDFVARVTTSGGADFVQPAKRIATFDHDGTLWTEQPTYFQLLFAVDRVKV